MGGCSGVRAVGREVGRSGRDGDPVYFGPRLVLDFRYSGVSGLHVSFPAETLCFFGRPSWAIRHVGKTRRGERRTMATLYAPGLKQIFDAWRRVFALPPHLSCCENTARATDDDRDVGKPIGRAGSQRALRIHIQDFGQIKRLLISRIKGFRDVFFSQAAGSETTAQDDQAFHLALGEILQICVSGPSLPLPFLASVCRPAALRAYEPPRTAPLPPSSTAEPPILDPVPQRGQTFGFFPSLSTVTSTYLGPHPSLLAPLPSHLTPPLHAADPN